MSILLIKYPVLFQVVGIEGNNPSGHCLSAAKIIDSIPLPSPADVSLPLSKKQAVDQDTISPDSSSLPEELSVVSKFDLSCWTSLLSRNTVERVVLFTELRAIILSADEYSMACYLCSKLKLIWHLSMQIIAAGPFTTTDNLFFEPLTELLAYARRMVPQLLIVVTAVLFPTSVTYGFSLFFFHNF